MESFIHHWILITKIPTYKSFRRSTGTPKTLEQTTEQTPPLKPTEVLIRIHAVSLNYRDVAMMDGKYPMETAPPEVVEIDSEVHDFKIGDHVVPIFDLDNMNGTEDTKRMLGGDVDGVLREYAVFEQDALLQLPKHPSWEEAACITCAGTTAWTALDMPRSKGTALLQGTGGVSMFGLLICLAADIRPIITSSSDQKLDLALSAGKPGSIDTINYRTHPQWEEEVHRLTNGRGVDVVVESVGVTTMARSLASLARRGTVSVVGFLGGFDVDRYPDTILPVLIKSATIRGIAVGSKVDQQNLCDFLTEKKVGLKPLLDETVFSFEDSQAAFDDLYAAKHTGRVVIRM
ncbi:uncharacterized protein N7498_002927 [Penicillium cinerascens]|uniref:Enoyl reductase (ER) domain-containing protein n=1 Tax=Penicillium cinerascens TaxID=70096 RepID=A0A9W9NAX5_9EURO|nr:uncharacterized protein N7498_002927 [Penicillium cinerascens]KAJ5216520.1 hypothetical protein N7498_002927 [Penicillium cinerascens]